MDHAKLHSAAQELARLLRVHQRRLALAESCTAGLVAACLGQVPGISEHLCGSAVTYRNQTKEDWLGIAAADLANPGPVSARVAESMARAVLQRTVEADMSLAITGHFGPGAPSELDGLVFTAIAHREVAAGVRAMQVRQHRLRSVSRAARQQEAAHLALAELIQTLSERQP